MFVAAVVKVVAVAVGKFLCEVIVALPGPTPRSLGATLLAAGRRAAVLPEEGVCGERAA
jgi:hypothetical protein